MWGGGKTDSRCRLLYPSDIPCHKKVYSGMILVSENSATNKKGLSVER